MNNYNKAITAIMSAVQNMIDKAVSNAPFDATYTGTIESAIKEDSNYKYYSVQVNGAAKTIKSKAEYFVGDIVYVVVPRGNWNHAYLMPLERKTTDTVIAERYNSRQNLLDNGWFTINQRGQDSYLGTNTGKYTFDRWKFSSPGPIFISRSHNYVRIDADGDLYQIIDDIERLNGKTLTLSVLFHSGQIFSYTIDSFDYSQSGGYNIGSNIQIYYDSELNAFGIKTQRTDAFIQAMKLEIGCNSTIMHDVAPNYAEELVKCQRYFWKGELWGVAHADGANIAHMLFTLPNDMRTAPVLTIKSFGQTIGQGTKNTITNLAISDVATYAHRVYIKATSSNLVSNQLYIVKSCDIELSADL